MQGKALGSFFELEMRIRLNMDDSSESVERNPEFTAGNDKILRKMHV